MNDLFDLLESLGPFDKPQFPVEIDWSHPKARGLASFVLFQANGIAVDLVSGISWTQVGPMPSGYGQLGVAAKPTGTQYAWLASNPVSAAGSPKSVMCAALAPSLAADIWLTYVSQTGGVANRTGLRYVNSVNQLWANENALGLGVDDNAVGTITANVPFHAIGNFVGASDRRLYLNGAKTTGTSTVAGYTTQDRLAVGTIIVNSDVGFGSWNGDIYYCAWWNHAWTDDEALELYAAPFQMLRPISPEGYTTPPPGTNVALTGAAATSAAGSFTPALSQGPTLTGAAATSAAGTLGVSGSSASLIGAEADTGAGDFGRGLTMTFTGAAATAGAGSLTITQGTLAATDLTANRIYQRAYGTTAKAITFAGSYTGQVPATIEIKIVNASGGATALDWTALSSPTIAAGAWSGIITVPQGGMYNFLARGKDAGGNVIFTTAQSSNAWGVGELLWMLGQSNMEKMWTIASSPPVPAANVRIYVGINTQPNTGGSIGWRALTGMGNGAIRLANLVASGAGIPVGLVASAIGATGLLSTANSGAGYWLDNGVGGLYTNAVTDLTNVGGDAAALFWHQGEWDTSFGPSSRTNYKAGLDTLYARVKVSNGRTTNTPFFCAILGTYDAAGGGEPNGSNDDVDAIRRAHQEWINATSGAQWSGVTTDIPRVDFAHWAASGYERAARRYANAYLFYIAAAAYSSRGPAFGIAFRTLGSTILRQSITQDAGTLLKDSAGGTSGAGLTAWRAFDNGVGLTISSTAFNGNQVVLNVSAAPSDAGPITDDYLYGATPTVTNLVYDNTSPQGDTIGLPLAPSDGMVTYTLGGGGGGLLLLGVG